MNRYLRMLIEVPTGILKMSAIKILNWKNAKVPLVCAASPGSELTVERKAIVKIGSRFRVRDGAHIRARKGAKLEIGNNVSVNHNCMIVCHDNIGIGDDVQFGPGVLIYDHDHDFRTVGGIKSMKYKTSPIYIGKNVWIGANSVILRGTVIGDNSVVAAGSVLKGEYPENSVIYQKKDTLVKPIEINYM